MKHIIPFILLIILTSCGVTNVTSYGDVSLLNTFVLDCLRAVQTGKKKLGGLGFDKTQKDGCIARGKGKNVKANRLATEQIIEGYLPIGCAQAAMLTRRAAYDALVDNI